MLQTSHHHSFFEEDRSLIRKPAQTEALHQSAHRSGMPCPRPPTSPCIVSLAVATGANVIHSFYLGPFPQPTEHRNPQRNGKRKLRCLAGGAIHFLKAELCTEAPGDEPRKCFTTSVLGWECSYKLFGVLSDCRDMCRECAESAVCSHPSTEHARAHPL